MVSSITTTTPTDSEAVLLPPEAERIVEQLHSFETPKLVGSRKWIRQHIDFQKLNLQAHFSVAHQCDNFVLDYLLTYDKLHILVKDLVMIEAWRSKLLTKKFPDFLQRCAVDFPIRTYHVLYHEATVTNLLEVLVYHDYVVEALEGSFVLDLIDYCCCNVAWLCKTSLEEDEFTSDPAHIKEEQGSPDENAVAHMQKQAKEIRWKSALACVTILRYLCEHVTKLHLSALTRLIDTHDVACLVIPLIENPPWTRRNERKWEKFYDQSWHEVAPEDLLKLTPMEAQIWLVLFNLLCERQVRQSYSLHSFRKDTLLRVRKYINAVLLDQLPVLAQLQRFLDELVIVDAPHVTQGVNKALIMQQVASIRDGLMERTDWEGVVSKLLAGDFKGKETQDDAVIQELAGLYSDDTLGVGSASSYGEQVSSPEVTPENVEKESLGRVSVTFQAGERKVMLQSTTQEGTAQATARGAFERFELTAIEAIEREKMGFVIGFDEQMCISCFGAKGKELLLVNEDGKSLAKGALNCVSPAEVHSLKDHGTWLAVGSANEDAILQLHCLLEVPHKSFTIDKAFLSIKRKEQI